MDFLRGQSGREFVHSPADVDARLASFDHARDPDGRFRVNVIFCGGDASWQYAVNRILIDSDCVLMDLRGFSRHRAGCVFEIRCLAESDLPFRTVFLVDETTDRSFVSETWAAAAKGASWRANGDAFQFVSEEPVGTTVSQRIIAAFSSPEAPLRGGSWLSGWCREFVIRIQPPKMYARSQGLVRAHRRPRVIRKGAARVAQAGRHDL